MNKKRNRRWLQLLALILLCLTLTVVSLPCPADVFASVGPNSTQTAPQPTQSAANSKPVGQTYVLNTNTKKFHIPTCRSVRQMKDKNKKDFCGSREEVIAKGYSPCKICSP